MKKLFLAATVVLVASLASAPLAQRDDAVPYQADKLVQHWHLLINQTFEDMKAYTATSSWTRSTS